MHAHALIHQHQQRAVAFFAIGAYVGLAQALRRTPVKLAQIIARQVAPQFLKVQPTPAQPRAMLAGQDAVDGLAAGKAQAARRGLQRHQVLDADVDIGITGGGGR